MSENAAPEILSREEFMRQLHDYPQGADVATLAVQDNDKAQRALIAELKGEVQRLTEERDAARASGATALESAWSELSALRAELAETRERANKNHDAALGFQNRALNAESLLASATDLMNTCAREWNVAQAVNESGIKDLFDRLWSEMSCRYFDKRDDEAKANQDAVALRAELEAVKRSNWIHDVVRDGSSYPIYANDGNQYTAEELFEFANLIAAAPDLLEAYRAAKKYLEPDLVEPGRTVFWELVSAIRKAEGRNA